MEPWAPDASHDGSVRSKLLLGGPHLHDPNFFRTVVLVLEHNALGAFGLVINRPLEVTVGEVVEPWARLGDRPIYSGGPVSPETGFGLARLRDGAVAPEGVRSILGELHMVDLAGDVDEIVDTLADLRVFSGYSGWAPGQLDAELEQLGWIVVDATLDDVFHPDPETQWSDVLRRQPGELRRLADYPVDPGLN